MFLAVLSFCLSGLPFTLDLVSLYPFIFPGYLGRHPIVSTDQTFPQLRTLALLCPGTLCSGSLVCHPLLVSTHYPLSLAISLSSTRPCHSVDSVASVLQGWLAYCPSLLARDTHVPPRHPEGEQNKWRSVILTVSVNWTSCSVPAHRAHSLPRQKILLGVESC